MSKENVEIMRGILRGRRSIRKYKAEEPPKEVLERVVEDALWAPSNMNVQPWHIAVVRGERREELLDVIRKSGEAIYPKLQKIFPDKPKVVKFTMEFFHDLGKAPILLFFFGSKEDLAYVPNLKQDEKVWVEAGRLTVTQSISAAIQNLLLSAHAEGLGTCWMTGPLHIADDIAALLGLPEQELVAVVTLGYPDQAPPAPPRKPGRVDWIGFEE